MIGAHFTALTTYKNENTNMNLEGKMTAQQFAKTAATNLTRVGLVGVMRRQLSLIEEYELLLSKNETPVVRSALEQATEKLAALHGELMKKPQ